MVIKAQRLPRAQGFSLIEVLLVVGVIGVVSAISVPIVGNTVAGFRLSGSARSLANAVAVAKIRAASTFGRVRLYADLATSTHRLETLDRTPDPDHWTLEGGATPIGAGIRYSFLPVTSPPPGTQQAFVDTPMCTTDAGVAIPNTWCITFNSRGVPVDVTGAPTSSGVMYVTDGINVFAVGVAATGMIGLWRTVSRATPLWTAQ